MPKRPPIKKSIKEELYKQAGNKCANPGCMNYRTHIHHIQEWHVYKTHNENHMIAVCPSCHDEIHYGKLKIDDQTIYNWKNIKRTSTNNWDSIAIEPSNENKIILGTMAFQSQKAVTVFELTKTSRLKFQIIGEDIFLLSLYITNLKGKVILKVEANQIRYTNDEHISYTRRPGRFRLTTKRLLDFIPEWAIPLIFSMQPEYKIEGELLLLDMEVIRPGEVKAEGFWSSEDAVIISTDKDLNFIRPGYTQPFKMLSEEGGYATIMWTGDINGKIFGL